MTALIVFIALIVANAVYCIRDGRRAAVNRQMDSFYRVEYKRCALKHEDRAAGGWL